MEAKTESWSQSLKVKFENEVLCWGLKLNFKFKPKVEVEVENRSKNLKFKYVAETSIRSLKSKFEVESRSCWYLMLKVKLKLGVKFWGWEM